MEYITFVVHNCSVSSLFYSWKFVPVSPLYLLTHPLNLLASGNSYKKKNQCREIYDIKDFLDLKNSDQQINFTPLNRHSSTKVTDMEQLNTNT